MDAAKTPAGLLSALSPAECWSLVSTQPVGRIAWSGPSGITVLPVNFVVDGESVHLRTAAYSELARECDDSPVAFQVDSFDEDTRSGWSVLLRGRAHADFSGSGPAAPPDVWPTGSHSLQVQVSIDLVSGRRVHSER